MNRKKETKTSPKADAMRKLREERYERMMQGAKASKNASEIAARAGAVLAEPDEDEDDGWRDIEAEARAKKGKRQ